MGFHEVRLLEEISYGSSGGPGFSTNIIQLDGGGEERVARWAKARHSYEIQYGVRSPETLHYLRKFYIARQGCANGFRFKDFSDFCTTSSGNNYIPPAGATTPQVVSNVDVVIGVGDGATTQFQLIKKYLSGPASRTRTITKPVLGTVLVAKDNVNQTSGWTVDTTTGIVTFTSAPAASVVITAGFEFDVPVRFGKEVDEELSQSLDDFGIGSTNSIPLVEIPDGLEVSEDVNCGGAKEVCLTATYQLAAGYARAYAFEDDGSPHDVKLPNTATTPTGSDLFRLYNVGTQTITVKDFTGSTLATLAVGDRLVVDLIDNGGTKVWYGS